MRIGDLARRTGLTASRIRFYESIGLLKSVTRQANGYREYPPQAALALQIITNAQQAGFTLDEIRTLMPSDLTSWKHDELVTALRNKIRDIEALEARLAASKQQMVVLLGAIENKPDDMACVDNARRVLSEVGGIELLPGGSREALG